LRRQSARGDGRARREGDRAAGAHRSDQCSFSTR
jgi:hypothetical protein